MRVKLKDVAQRANVSTATASLALNGSGKVNANTRARIREIAGEMGYQPNPMAKRLAMRKSRQIGLVLPDITNTYYAALAQYILNELLASDYALTISTSMNSRKMEDRIVDDMIANRVEGLLVAPVEKENPDVRYLDRLDKAGIPCVFVTAGYPGSDHPCVMCDLYGGMRELLERLRAMGCARVALLSGTPNVQCFDLRDSAYLDFIREHGSDDGQLHHLYGVRYDDAYRFAASMDVSRTDAVVCVNDMMALGVVNALRERGVRVPEDVAVAGFDDSIFSRVSPISITTVRQDVHRIGAEAAACILRLARGEPLERPKPIPCTVVLRQSTGNHPQCGSI